jgi:hypothetical protein
MRNPLGRAAVAMSAALLVACSTSEASPVSPPPNPNPEAKAQPANPGPITLRTARERHSPGVVAAGGGDAPYNYAPAVIAEGGRYRMWWCSQLGIANPPGDDILFAESSSLDGGFAGPDGTPGTPIFSGSFNGFDAVHVCDPSVIKVGGTYYMYYTGWGGEQVLGNTIGLATSPDGRVWSRSAKPILGPSREVMRDNVYGAGQPAAVFLDGWFYLMFTDTSGRAAKEHGIGQFVLRAKDPAFTANVEALGPGGFQAVPDTSARLATAADAFTADLTWVDALGAFAIAYEVPDGTRIIFWDKDFRSNPYQPIVLSGPWREGPGLVRRPDGHAVVPPNDPCDTVPLDLIRGSREGNHGPTDLMHFGVDLTDVGACRDPGRALAVLDGFAVPSPKRTIDLIVSGKVIRVERRSVAEALATRVLDFRVAALDKVPVAGEVSPGVPARRAAGRGVGLLIDNELWAVPSTDVAERNSSAIQDITPAAWDFYERGPNLIPAAR